MFFKFNVHFFNLARKRKIKLNLLVYIVNFELDFKFSTFKFSVFDILLDAFSQSNFVRSQFTLETGGEKKIKKKSIEFKV